MPEKHHLPNISTETGLVTLYWILNFEMSLIIFTGMNYSDCYRHREILKIKKNSGAVAVF
jgi:hypothetical protein